MGPSILIFVYLVGVVGSYLRYSAAIDNSSSIKYKNLVKLYYTVGWPVIFTSPWELRTVKVSRRRKELQLSKYPCAARNVKIEI